MVQIPDDVLRLKDEYLTLSDSDENQRRLRCWEPEVCARDQWHGRPRLHSFREQALVPLEVTIQHPFFLTMFGQNLADVYQDPVAYLRFHLQRMIWVFRYVPDDIPLDRVLPIYLSSPFEPSLLGVAYHFFPNQDPLIDQKQPPPVLSRHDLERLKPIDFSESGMMPLAHHLFEGVRGILGDEFTVVFPEWLRSQFGVALYVRGYQDLLIDTMTDPEFVHSIMARITHERQAWFEARARYLGEPIPPTSIFDDEVDAAVIGPQHYREFILPYEKAVGQYHKRVSYWHSCGNIGPMARDIMSIGCIDMLDVSGWTDLERVLSSIDATNLRLEIRFKPVEDLQDASPQWMEQRLRRALRLCRRHDVSAIALRVSGIQPWHAPGKDIEQVKLWIVTARRVALEVTKEHDLPRQPLN